MIGSREVLEPTQARHQYQLHAALRRGLLVGGDQLQGSEACEAGKEHEFIDAISLDCKRLQPHQPGAVIDQAFLH